MDIAAKLRAAAQNRDVAFALDTDARTCGLVGAGPPQTLATTTDLSVTAARPYLGEAKEVEFVFFSDGTSWGRHHRLTDQHQLVAIGVEWLTGAVSIERGAP